MTLRSLASLLLVVALSACSGPPHGAATRPPPAFVLQGQDTFLDGQLSVFATVSNGYAEGAPRGGPRSDRHPEHRSRHQEMERVFEGEAMPSRVNDRPLPPVVLRVRVANTTSAPIDVTFVECASALGNFGVRPTKTTLEANQSIELEPMTSLLGLSGEALPVTLTLKHKGKLEKKSFILKQTQP
jgi:hypothetical protein